MKDIIETFKWKWDRSKLEFLGSIVFVTFMGILLYTAMYILH